jgi:phosphoglucosamine mutase
VAYLVRQFGADAGVVISASHNSFEHNGIKLFNGDGYKLDDNLEEEIEDIIARDLDISSHITGDRLGRVLQPKEDAEELYAGFLKNTVDADLSGMSVVIDCANGAASRIAEKVLADLGMRLRVIHNEPDGVNINKNCGSTHPGDLQEAVRREGAALGLAFDGDADRLIAVDELGRIVDGDRIMYICAKMLKDRGELPFDLVTTTVMSNLGFHRAVESLGLQADITQVGDRYVLERMLDTGCVIGGEQSGHIIFRKHTTTGDGILSALQLLQACRMDGRPLSAMADDVVLYPQVLKNVKVRNENKKYLDKDREVARAIVEAEQKLGRNGRILIRPSGTEPLVRVMIEGEKLDEIEMMAETLARLIARNLG